MSALASLVAAGLLAAAAPRAVDEPALRAEVGVPVAWRSAWVHDLAGQGGYDYGTGMPYVGYALRLRGQPLRLASGLRAPGWALPLELDLAFTQRFFGVEVPGGLRRGAGEERFSVDLAYRWRLASRLRLGGRAGWALHRFTVEANPVLPPSSRDGLRLGADAGYALAAALRAEAGLRWYPSMGPGAEERRQFGTAASGWGYELLASLEGPFAAGAPLGWRAEYDLLRFSDSYAGGVAPGNGAATYHTVTLSLTYQR